MNKKNAAVAGLAGLAGAAALAAGTEAYAEVVRYDGPVTLCQGGSSLGCYSSKYLDVTMPESEQVWTEGIRAWTYLGYYAGGSTGYEVARSGTNLKLFNAGEVIGGDSIFSSASTYGSSFDDKYIGIKLPGNRYGWVQMDIAYYGLARKKIQAVAWGYETEPGVGIRAGAGYDMSYDLLPFTSVSGTWTKVNDDYSGADAAGPFGIMLYGNAQTSQSIAIEADIYSNPDGLNKNGVIVFDYKGPNDFKYAAMKDGANIWTLGYYNGDGTWHDVASFSETIDTSRWYRMRVEISGVNVKLYVDDKQGSGYAYKTEADFSSVGTGGLGLAVRQSQALFKDFAFSEWTPVSGTWQIGDSQSDGLDTTGPFGISLHNGAKTSNSYTIEIESDINSQPDGVNKNGVIVFDYKSPNDFKYAAMKDGADKWTIGYYNGDGTWHDTASFSEPIDTSRWYRMRTEISGSFVRLYVDDKTGNGYVYKTGIGFLEMGEGRLGLGVRQSHALFKDFIFSQWMTVSGTWLPGIQYDGLDITEPFGISLHSGYKTSESMIIESDVSSQPDGWNKNGVIIFDYNGPDDFKYAALKDGVDNWTIGYYNGDGTWHDIASFSEPIDTSKWYRVKVEINGANVKLYADDKQGSGYVYKTEADYTSMGTGLTGLGVRQSHALFENFSVR
ncbi:MAG: hypothetical protein C4560_07360 [Nitrospiraceae bacterium]|nr:MAG: hypothetical protein C4560_07360 [Nitrospiraceae bacterium]